MNQWSCAARRHCVRAVKEMDSKSIGPCPQGSNPLGVDWFEVGEEVDWFKVGEEMVWSRRGVEKRMGALMVREKKRRVCESGSE